MGAKFLDENGKEQPIIMGSYGIGVERVMACYIEQHNDEQGLVWDKTLAPFQVHLMGLNMKKEEVVKICNKFYDEMNAKGIEVLYDDRVEAQAGFKFKDADLLGMPVQVVVGDKKLKDNKVEVKIRKTGERFDINVNELISKVQELLK
jgi:prolyl-tRNA synthetase